MPLTNKKHQTDLIAGRRTSADKSQDRKKAPRISAGSLRYHSDRIAVIRSDHRYTTH